jgi:hypothetical protein
MEEAMKESNMKLNKAVHSSKKQSDCLEQIPRQEICFVKQGSVILVVKVHGPVSYA